MPSYALESLFINLPFIFSSAIHLELIVYAVYSKSQDSLSSPHTNIQLAQYHLLKNLFFYTVI